MLCPFFFFLFPFFLVVKCRRFQLPVAWNNAIPVYLSNIVSVASGVDSPPCARGTASELSDVAQKSRFCGWGRSKCSFYFVLVRACMVASADDGCGLDVWAFAVEKQWSCMDKKMRVRS
ncbi:unnamed protein product [Ixodes hexagonus]